jgi:hypothetical protein
MTLRLLREARERGRFGPAPLAGHAVTPALVALGDEEGEGAGPEELEWAASVAASLDSLRLLAREGAGDEAGLRRVVAAVDVPAVDPGAGDEPPGNELSGVVLHEVPLRRLVALLVDSPGAAPLVGAACHALAAGAEADDPAVERCLEEDLGWWAASELDVLLG